MADDIETKVAFLSSPASYPFAGSQVRVKETRTSWVFVTAGEVYKLKKPIKDRLVDFTSVESRYRNATEEVRLNRRLAPDVRSAVVMPLIEGKITPEMVTADDADFVVL